MLIPLSVGGWLIMILAPRSGGIVSRETFRPSEWIVDGAHESRERRLGVVVVSRRKATADIEAMGLGGATFEEALTTADLAVNATTVGMVDPGVTMDVNALPDHATVFDLVYVPPETPLLASALARGLRAANGSEMLIAQAAIAFERWTGVGGMADVMRGAVAPLLADPTFVAGESTLARLEQNL